MAFAENLKYLMSFYDLSNYRLAKELECSQTTIANWLDGVTLPHKKMQIKIAEKFGISANDLMTDKIPHISKESKFPVWSEKEKKPAPKTRDELEDEYIQLFRALSLEERNRELAYLRELVDGKDM